MEGRSIKKCNREDEAAAQINGCTDIFKKSLVSIGNMERLMARKSSALSLL